MEKLIKTSKWITFAWIMAINGFLWVDIDLGKPLSLDEFGVFLSGMSAPIIILWTIVGIYQLKETNNEKLKRLKKDQEPYLIPLPGGTSSGPGGIKINIRFINQGSTALNLNVKADGVDRIEARPSHAVEMGKEGTIHLENQRNLDKPIKIKFTYENISRENFKIEFPFDQRTSMDDLKKYFSNPIRE